MKKSTLLALTALIASSSRAQLAITPVAGLNVSNYRFASGNYPFEQNKPLIGYCVGVLVGIPLTNRLSLQPGALYKLNGFRWGETADVKQKISINTIDIPVKLVYSFNIGKGSRLFIGAGPYAAINVSGKYHLEGYLTFDSTNGPTVPRHVDQTIRIMFGSSLDIGAGASIGVKMRNGLFVSAQGQYGVKDLAPSGLPSHLHNYNFGVVGGYSFKLKKHKMPAEPPAKTQ